MHVHCNDVQIPEALLIHVVLTYMYMYVWVYCWHMHGEGPYLDTKYKSLISCVIHVHLPYEYVPPTCTCTRNFMMMILTYTTYSHSLIMYM